MSNPLNSLDVNGDGQVVPLDVLIIINAMNEVGGGKLPEKVLSNPRFAAPKAYLDANRDGSLSPSDALVIINYLNRSVAEAEGEATPTLLVGSANGDPNAAIILPVWAAILDEDSGTTTEELPADSESLPALVPVQNPIVAIDMALRDTWRDLIDVSLDEETLDDVLNGENPDELVDEVFGNW